MYIIYFFIQDGEAICEIQHSSGSPIRVCAFSASSAMFATGGDDETVVLWDIATKSTIRYSFSFFSFFCVGRMAEKRISQKWKRMSLG